MPPNQEKWDNLVRYLRKCVTADRDGDLIPFGSDRWGPAGLTEETLITSPASALVANPEVESMEKRLGPGEVLAYGWPTLVMKSKSGSLGVAPLFFIELEPRKRDSDELAIAEDVPSLNPLLFDDKFIAPDVRGLLDDQVASGIPYDDPTLLKEWVVAVARILGIEVHSLDENNLEAAPAQRAGIHNAAILVQVEASFMTKALLEELSTLIGRTDWVETPAALLLGLPIQRREKVILSPAASPVPLSGAQEEALEKVRADRLSVITGPPGTGKTQLVVAAVANAWLDGRSILVSSTNNAAVDVAVDRTNERAGFRLIIRTGNRDRREAVATLVTSILAEATVHPSEEATTRRALHLAVQTRAKVHSQVSRLAEVESEMGRAAGMAEALGAYIWPNKSLRDKAINLVGVRPMSARAKHLISAWFFGNYRRRKFLLSLEVGASATVKDVYAWASGEVAFLKLFHEAQALRLELPDERVALGRVDDDWARASQDAVKHSAAAAIKKHRALVSAIGAARLGGPGLGRAIGSSLRGARGWGCTALSVKQSFPLEAGILDTVLIDEASQCTLAVALPLAYRAKNLVVVGDPNQLTPIIKVDQEHLRSLAVSCGLNHAVLGQAGMGYGDGSAFTAFAHVVGSDQISLLDEHFRCHPAIARWFNSMFYGGQLRVLTDVAGLAKGERGLAWIDVLGRAEMGSASGAHNPIEAQLIVEAIGVELGRGASIGVVTPFAAQASAIRRMAQERYSEEALEGVDFTSGTAHRLQGNERDVVFFSCVVADGIRPGTARWVERERNLLNVAVSRAKARLVVFGHPNVGSLGVPSLAALRIAAIEGPADIGEASWLIHSEAEGLLLDGLYGAGFAPLLKPLEEGYELDFALIGSRGRLNIEVDGDHHFDNAGRQRRQDLVRDRVLEGLGWRVFRVPTWRCYRDINNVIEEIVIEFGMLE